MSMNRNIITLRKLSGLYIKPMKKPELNTEIAMQMNAEMLRLGYIMSDALLGQISTMTIKKITKLYNSVIPILQEFKGDHVAHNVMYPNFPEQVMEVSDYELYANAFLHYVSYGEWKPQYDKIARKFQFETTKLKVIDTVTKDQYKGVFTTLLKSNDSISEVDRLILLYMMTNIKGLVYPEDIPYKETLCLVAHYNLINDQDITPFVKNATDVLRICTFISDGDITLATNTKFKSLPRKQRKALTVALEGVIREEDIQRHRNKWVRLFHNLHVGDFSRKVFDIASIIRSNGKLKSLGGRIEQCIMKGEVVEASRLLMKRPGDYARRLDHMLRISPSSSQDFKIVSDFLAVAEKVSTRVLLQVLGHFKGRGKVDRVIFPKGNTQKAIRLDKHENDLSKKTLKVLKRGIKQALIKRFSELPELGAVYLDKRLKRCPLPAQQRSASDSVDTVARGTKMPLGDKNTIRMFLYWVGLDIDLSATFHDENFKMLERIAYTNMRSNLMNCCHSGDITSARNGASEFIDIDISNVPPRIRYVVMNVLSYSRIPFDKIEESFAGWMMRDEPNSNEIYDPKTVEAKFSLNGTMTNSLPIIFDLHKREVIWADLYTRGEVNWNSESTFGHRWNPVGNNVENNQASIEETLLLMTQLHKRVSLYDLFWLHAEARAKAIHLSTDEGVVGEAYTPDISFDMLEGTVTPKDITTINSDYIIG